MIYKILATNYLTKETATITLGASSYYGAECRLFETYPQFSRKTHHIEFIDSYYLQPSIEYGTIIQNEVIQEENPMQDLLYDLIDMGDYNKNISDLSKMAIREEWTQNSNENIILKNYLSKTLERIQDEDKLLITNDYCAFNTGLFTPNYESIYMLAVKSISSFKNWTFKEWCTEYKLGTLDIPELPKRADYFKDPSLLIFDWHYKIRPQYGHILDNPKNIERLPLCIKNSTMRLQLFTGVVDTSIKKVIANYKLAVPQYYEKQIQLLIPLYFENQNTPDLALAITKKNGYYQGHTCLTLDMAYNNARLIAKPESNWLTNNM